MRKEMVWPRQVKAPEDAPPVFRPFFEELGSSNSPQPAYAVFSPADRFGRRKTLPRILCLLQDRIVVLTASREGLGRFELPYSAVSSVEIGGVLLYAWFKLSGEIGDERVETVFEYNAVADLLFRRAAERIRAAITGLEPPKAEERTLTAMFDPLLKENYKYMNFAKMSLLPHEAPLYYVYQPEVREKRGFFVKTPFKTEILILTDHELTRIRDDEESIRHNIRYGGVWRHIPLQRIVGMTLIDEANGLTLLIERDRAEPLRIAFSNDKRGELLELQRRFYVMRSGESLSDPA